MREEERKKAGERGERGVRGVQRVDIDGGGLPARICLRTSAGEAAARRHSKGGKFCFSFWLKGSEGADGLRYDRYDAGVAGAASDHDLPAEEHTAARGSAARQLPELPSAECWRRGTIGGRKDARRHASGSGKQLLGILIVGSQPGLVCSKSSLNAVAASCPCDFVEGPWQISGTARGRGQERGDEDGAGNEDRAGRRRR